MTDKVTPIPKRASRPRTKPLPAKSEPKPLMFPQPNRNITVVPATGESFTGNIALLANPSPFTSEKELRDFVANCIARTIYHALDIPEAEIITMGEAQFQAFCRSVLEDAG